MWPCTNVITRGWEPTAIQSLNCIHRPGRARGIIPAALLASCCLHTTRLT